jgi:hypothetical protein
MALNFPNTPQSGDSFTSGTTTWQFDGIAWNIVANLANAVSIPNNFNTISVDGQSNVLADGQHFLPLAAAQAAEN